MRYFSKITDSEENLSPQLVNSRPTSYRLNTDGFLFEKPENIYEKI